MSPFASAGETITFFHNDVAGSPALATDTNGLIAWKETYRPYGERVIQATASTSNDLWFTGKSHDETTGLTYMGARYYDPVIGRFSGIDPAAIDFENPHGLNRFAYANNNPYKCVDPDGRLPVFVIPLIIKAIDVAFTAHDVYTAAQQGGAAGVAKVATENAVLSAVPGGKIGNKIVDAVRKADVPSGGTYLLRDPVSGQIRRTGRTNNLARRESEHARSLETRDLDFEVDRRTDSYPAQRGREQRIYEAHPEADLNRRRPISPRNPNGNYYLQEGDRL